MPLTLTLRVGEGFKIGDVATVRLVEKSGQAARLAIEADKSIPIQRLDAIAPRGTSWGLTGKEEKA